MNLVKEIFSNKIHRGVSATQIVCGLPRGNDPEPPGLKNQSTCGQSKRKFFFCNLLSKARSCLCESPRALGRWIHERAAATIVLVLSLGYSLVFDRLSFLKTSNFYSNLDLGLSNHIYWLLSTGGLPGYASSGFSSVYPMQFEEPIYFVVAPFYALWPGIPFLLALQSFAIGLSAIPLFLIARKQLRSEWTAAWIPAIYLSFFTVTSANLFDFHNQSLFPLFYFFMVYFSMRGDKFLYMSTGFVAASIDPLSLLLVVFFAATEYLPRGLPVLRFSAKSIGFFAKRLMHRPAPMILAVSLLFVLAGEFYFGFFGYTLSGSGSTSGGILSTLMFSVNQKVEILLLLFGALAFLPLLKLRTLILMLPYVGFVFYSTNPATWQPFGLQYAILGTAPLFVGLILALRSLDTGRYIQALKRGPTPRARNAFATRLAEDPSPLLRHGPPSYLSNVRFRNPAPTYRHLTSLLIIWAIFALLYFPLSPLNQYVSGGYFAGNENLRTITGESLDASFLDRVMSLIPKNASVLTQNNIPQLSGREYYETPLTFDPNIVYDYLLVDQNLSYFASPDIAWLLSRAQMDLNNGSYGILAEGKGALLLERAYSGPVLLFQPTVTTYLGSQMLVFDATVQGSTLIGGSPSGWMWYGPYSTLFPGRYEVTFALSANTTQPPRDRAITLDVVNGTQTFASLPVDLGSFSGPQDLTYFRLNFTIPKVTEGMQYRGTAPTGATQLTLWTVSVEMQAPL